MKRPILLALLPLLLAASCRSGNRPVSAVTPDCVSVTECTACAEAAAEAAETEEVFRAYPIDAAIFARIDGRSYKKGCTVPLTELRYLRVLHIGFDGETHQGELICNQAIADDLLDIFRVLYEARYPIERMVLIDEYEADDTRSMEANNSSGFNYREIRNTGKLSNHSFGYAVDINPLYNPCVIERNGQTTVDPEAGRPYADRSQDFPGKIDRNDLCYQEFIRHGFIWGGDWKSLKDYQHFEKKPVQ